MENKTDNRTATIVILVGIFIMWILLSGSTPQNTGPEYSGVSHCCGE